VKYQPHCLSRGFRTDEEASTGKMDGSALMPTEIEKILQLDSYEDFVTALEKDVHDVIPFGVGGDFETFSAPFEPLFWLHHSQLDRLWWMWQNEEERHLSDYSGYRFRHTIQMAGLEDDLDMGGVLGDLGKVRAMMNVSGGCDEDENSLLCYEYS